MEHEIPFCTLSMHLYLLVTTAVALESHRNQSRQHFPDICRNRVKFLQRSVWYAESAYSCEIINEINVSKKFLIKEFFTTPHLFHSLTQFFIFFQQKWLYFPIISIQIEIMTPYFFKFFFVVSNKYILSSFWAACRNFHMLTFHIHHHQFSENESTVRTPSSVPDQNLSDYVL